MYSLLEKKTEQINVLKLNSLNTLRSIGVRNRHIDAWKRVHMAIMQSNIPRLRELLMVAYRAGSSVVALLEKVKQAAERKYSPKSYDETQYQLGYLLYKIGGRAAADLAYTTLGTPSVDTSKRHISTNPLVSSASFPTRAELLYNLNACYPSAARKTTASAIKGMTLQIDEIKIQERLRWDPKSNQILGVCREHGGQCSLEFRSMHQADDLLDCLQKNVVHLATEATVIGASILSRDPNDYTTPSDGDSRRRRALISIALGSHVSPSSPLHKILGDLPLFNLACGNDDLTPDFDWKHVLKRFRNTTLRQKGISINDVAISTDTIKTHLISAGLSADSADVLLAPNDRQDVVLMIKLLHALASLQAPTVDDSPLVHATRRSLVLLGRVYWNLLRAYLDVSLSLNDQLVHLSTAAHLILAIYNQDKGDFIPVQTYFDVESMIKNIYFCVAKTQLDDPDGEFWIVLLGTDGLEKTFGQVRTIVGNDTNADQLQLTNRIDGAVQCVNILEQHPEWGGQSRRLSVKPLFSTGGENAPVNGEINSVYDHISPKSCTGDLRVSEVNLRGCWLAGRRAAETTLTAGNLEPPFADMEKKGGYDKVHKATVLRLYSNPMAVKDSKDRLKRVRGFSQYHEIPSTVNSFVPDSENPNTVHVQDPALTLLSLFDASHQPDGADWQWIGNFEKKATFHNVSGRSIELINPVIQQAARGRNSGQDTYVFRTADLRALSAILFQKVLDEPGIIPEVPLTPTFPYRRACFVCEKDIAGGDPSQEADNSCQYCRQKVLLDTLSNPILISHIGAHILHDPRLKDVQNPCGFCLRSGTMTGDDDDFYMPFLKELRQPAVANIPEHLNQQVESQLEGPAAGDGSPSDTAETEKTSVDISRGHLDDGGILDPNDAAIPIPPSTRGGTSEVANAEVPPLSRKRKAAAVVPDTILDDLMICADDSCCEMIEEGDLLTCTAPGCGQNYHLTCQGFIEKPLEFFCDDQCKQDAGFRVGNKRRRR
ncbi:hypothetical protein HYPSUDRAFT_135245 [Hypholoma sublateritium FD-334 SS-4]|uniref:Zinc finger PHD-type domain-containing protein n=1 Tax=Hypholoma sublateritium (strain FD-334 SS-4) TaxID=945553 RepID=A0A0D2P957_HYPSF|nr:hypothetical protein HYPSUDRAFT_135245 [Hypholoma sublateritium FD-334 SS-4]